jgi:flavin reductase (DIM6/NTAB) family NADH-FMN oxidoreductase RutF
MVASGDGMAVYIRKPSTWLVFPSNRYTLELIKKEQAYTLSFFPDSHREQFMLLGKKSGRDTDKMKEVELTVILLIGRLVALISTFLMRLKY